MPLIPALKTQRQADTVLNDNLVYRSCSRTTKATHRETLFEKTKTKTKQKPTNQPTKPSLTALPEDPDSVCSTTWQLTPSVTPVTGFYILLWVHKQYSHMVRRNTYRPNTHIHKINKSKSISRAVVATPLISQKQREVDL